MPSCYKERLDALHFSPDSYKYPSAALVQLRLVASLLQGATGALPDSLNYCLATEACSVLVADNAWVHLHPSPGSFKLTCGASGVDHLLFQPAPVAGLVLQSIQLCPAAGPSHWHPAEGIPEPSCHG